MIAARYDVEPVLVASPRGNALHLIARDFTRLRELGFTAVDIERVAKDDRTVVLDSARQEGLAVALALPELDRYVVTGRLGHDHKDLSELVQHEVPGAGGSSDVKAITVRAGRTKAARTRAEAVCRAVDARGCRSMLVGDRADSPGARGVGGPAIIDVCVDDRASAGKTLEAWLRAYHGELLAGRTTGVIFDRYRRLPGDPAGIDAGTADRSPAYLAALKALLDRARVWGEPLMGATPAAERGLASAFEDVAVSALVREKRRFILIANRSADRHVRETIRLPEVLIGADVARAVEIPASSTKPAGRVIQAERGQVALTVALRPGDAALFEIF